PCRARCRSSTAKSALAAQEPWIETTPYHIRVRGRKGQSILGSRRGQEADLNCQIYPNSPPPDLGGYAVQSPRTISGTKEYLQKLSGVRFVRRSPVYFSHI